MDQLSETTPLLGEQAPQVISNNQPPPSKLQWLTGKCQVTAKNTVSHLQKWAVLWMLGLFILVLDFPGFMAQTILIRIYEIRVCRDYYLRLDPNVIDRYGNIEETFCKIRPVQSRLARLIGNQSLLDEVLSMFLVMPYGILADSYGRKTVIGLAVIGLCAGQIWTVAVLMLYKTFPTNAVYASTAFKIVGGGNSVAVAVLLAMVSDVCTPEVRTQAFFLIQLTMLIPELIAPPFGKLLSQAVGPHTTVLITTFVSLSTVPMLLLIPETLKREHNPGNAMSHFAAEEEVASARKSTIRSKVDEIQSHILNGVIPMLQKPLVLFALMALFVNKLSRPIMAIMLQYMSAVFSWSLADAGVLLSIQAAVQIGMVAVVLPLVLRLLTGVFKDPEVANLQLSRGSVSLMTIGAIGMGLAPISGSFIAAMVVYILGCGYLPAMRSFITSLVAKDEVALLYTIMAIFDGIGALAGTPLLSRAFAFGLDQGGILVGLPFFIAATMYALSTLMTFIISPPGQQLESEDSTDA